VPVKIDSVTDGGIDYGYNLFNNCARADGGGCPVDWYEGMLSAHSKVHDNLLNIAPGFRDASTGDFSLLPDSLAIDAGDPATINEMGIDGSIPQRADIGAFETELVLEPGPAFAEMDGQVVMEAEHFTWGHPAWVNQTALADFAGSGYLSALPDIDRQYETPDTLTPNPNLKYTIHFTNTGVYHIWLRGYAPNGAGDSVYIGLDDQSPLMLTGFAPRQWSWTSKTNTSGEEATIVVTEPGLHTLYLWQREDGIHLDRIMLTTDTNEVPSGQGPPESHF
jgi:hypothetical protein